MRKLKWKKTGDPVNTRQNPEEKQNTVQENLF